MDYGSIIGGALKFGAAGMSAIASKRQQKRQFRENSKARQWQMQEREQMQNWAAEQAQIDRDFQSQEAKISRDWNAEQAQINREWELEQWNRNNEYNSPTAQRERLEVAGFSPIQGVENGQSFALSSQPAQGVSAPSGSTASSSPSDPSVSVPEVNNPIGDALQSYIDYQAAEIALNKLDLEKMKTDADIKETIARTEKTWSDKKTVDALRDGEVEYLGVKIDLGKSQRNMTDAQAKKFLQDIAESEQRVKQSIQWCNESGVRMDLMSWQKFVSEQKLPKELQLLGANIILQNERADDIRLSKHNKARVLEQQYFGHQIENNRNRLKFMQEKWYNTNLFEEVENRKLDKLESEVHLNYSNMTSAALSNFNQAWRNYTLRQSAKSYGRGYRPNWQRSLPNPY